MLVLASHHHHDHSYHQNVRGSGGGLWWLLPSNFNLEIDTPKTLSGQLPCSWKVWWAFDCQPYSTKKERNPNNNRGFVGHNRGISNNIIGTGPLKATILFQWSNLYGVVLACFSDEVLLGGDHVEQRTSAFFLSLSLSSVIVYSNGNNGTLDTLSLLLSIDPDGTNGRKRTIHGPTQPEWDGRKLNWGNGKTRATHSLSYS